MIGRGNLEIRRGRTTKQGLGSKGVLVQGAYGRTADYVNTYIILSGSGFGVQGSPGPKSAPEHLPSIPEQVSISYLAVKSSPRLL